MTKTLTEQQIRKIIENGTGKAAKLCKQKFYDKPKSLTEQWREGTLPIGNYYIRVKEQGEEKIIDHKITGSVFFYDQNVVLGIVAPVPSYDKVKEMSQKIERLEFDNEALEMAHNEGKEINAELVSKTEQLEKKLAIATKALKEYSVSDNWFMEDSEGKCWSFNKQYPWRIGFKALKEMEGVK